MALSARHPGQVPGEFQRLLSRDCDCRAGAPPTQVLSRGDDPLDPPAARSARQTHSGLSRREATLAGSLRLAGPLSGGTPRR